MSIRKTTRRLGPVAVAAAMGTVAVLSFAAPAFASGPANGSQVPGSAVPIGSYTPGTPFSSGQTISVQIPANSDFKPGVNIKILECADPGGLPANLPTDLSTCDGNTIDGDTILANSDGSVSYDSYTVYALPDAISLGEPSNQTPVCNLSNECVLYIGEDQTDFTQPHFFSQPFYVKPNIDDGGEAPGDGTPEAPLVIGLPLAAAGLVGGLLFVRRRRSLAGTKA
jgi:hypothetical protein